MKPKKTTAPSDSQRDSQEWKIVPDSQMEWIIKTGAIKLVQFMEARELDKIIPVVEWMFESAQSEKDKAHQAGFQEAVELMKKEFKKIHIWKNCSDDFNAELPPVMRASEIKNILESLKPTPDQGSEGEDEK